MLLAETGLCDVDKARVDPVVPGGTRGCEVSRNIKSTKIRIYFGFLGNRFRSYDKAVSCYEVFGYRSHNYMTGEGGGVELSGCGDSDNWSRGDTLLVVYSRPAAWFHVTVCCRG